MADITFGETNFFVTQSTLCTAILNHLLRHIVRITVAVHVHIVAQQSRIARALCSLSLRATGALVHHHLVHGFHLGSRSNHRQGTLEHIDTGLFLSAFHRGVNVIVEARQDIGCCNK